MNSEAQKTCPAVCNSEKQGGFARRFVKYEPTAWSPDTFITHTAPIQVYHHTLISIFSHENQLLSSSLLLGALYILVVS